MADHNDIILKIINCVKQYPALYDTAHEDYNRYYKKIQIWNNIASEVNYSDGKWFVFIRFSRAFDIMKFVKNFRQYRDVVFAIFSLLFFFFFKKRRKKNMKNSIYEGRKPSCIIQRFQQTIVAHIRSSLVARPTTFSLLFIACCTSCRRIWLSFSQRVYYEVNSSWAFIALFILPSRIMFLN